MDIGISRLQINTAIFDARGNGGGIISPTITGDHQNRITDYTAIVLEVYSDELDSVGCSEQTHLYD